MGMGHLRAHGRCHGGQIGLHAMHKSLFSLLLNRRTGCRRLFFTIYTTGNVDLLLALRVRTNAVINDCLGFYLILDGDHKW
jgi:hypothetical protein